MKTMSNTKFWIYIFLAFMVGILIAPKGETKTITETKEVCTQEATWRELKDIDDRGFQLSAEGFSIVSEAFTLMGELDIEGATAKIEELNDVAVEVEAVVKERQEVLKELGY